MSFVAAAVAGSAVLGYSASRSASKAASKAADQQKALGDDANKLGRDQFDWFKAEYAATKPTRDAAEALSNKVSAAQLEGMETATQQAKDLDARNKTVFQPLEDSIVADASNFDTAGRRTQAVNEATADVESAFGRAQDDLGRTLARSGVTPGGGRSQSLMQDAALKKATAIAGATTGAVKNVEQQGYARKMDAVGLGKGIVGNQATMQQIAQSGGARAVDASGAAINASQSGSGLMQAGFNGARAGINSSGALYGQAASMSGLASQQRMQGYSMLGQAAGFMAGGIPRGMAPNVMGSPSFDLMTTDIGIASDEGIKKGTGKRLDGKKALKGIVNTPVDADWQYDLEAGGPDEAGQRHDGPMAQKVRKHMGNKVAPGGKVIDLASMNGQLMAGMQELASRMTKLEKRVAA